MEQLIVGIMNELHNSLKNIIVLLLTAMSFACGSNIKSLSDIKWSGRNTGFSEMIETMGYYKLYPEVSEAFTFYDDGTIVLCNRTPDDTTHYEGQCWPPGCYFDCANNQWGTGTTGVYEIKGDTIYANLYFRNILYFSSHFRIHIDTWMYKMRFKILDRTKIFWIDERLMDKEFPNPDVKNDTLFFSYFHKTGQLPPPNTEMKKKQWLWQEKSDWKDYKRNQKGMKE